MARINPQQVAKIAKMYGVDPRVFVNQIRQESGFRTDARSGAGAEGIAQIVYRYHPDAPPPSNPIGQLKYAAHMMKGLVNKYGNYSDALSVYNSGRPYSTGKGISETRNYVQSILGGSNPSPGKSPPSFSGSTPAAPSSSGLAQFLMANNNAFISGNQNATNTATNLLALLANNTSAPTPPGVPSQGGSVLGGSGGPKEQELIAAMNQAKKMGLRIGENSLYDNVDPVHVKGSYHYQYYPGSYKGKRVNRAADISGNAGQMGNFYNWVAKNYGKDASEIFYRNHAVKNGRPANPIGGHNDHVHIAF